MISSSWRPRGPASSSRISVVFSQHRCVNQCIDYMCKPCALREAIAVRKLRGSWINIPRRNIVLGVTVGTHL